MGVTSGSVTTSSSEGRSVTFNWTATQNPNNNTSLVSWSLVGSGNASGWVTVSELRVTINGNQEYYRSYENHTDCYIGTVLATGTFLLFHNNDGTKSMTVYVEAGIYNWAINCDGTGTFELTAIPRASTLTFGAASVAMGREVAITVTRASTSFTHKLSYSFGSLTNQTNGLSASTGVATSATFTPPTSLASQIPSATSGVCTVRCDTYNGSTLIGTSYASLTLTVPAADVPTISSVTIAEATEGIAAKFAAYVQSKSTLAVSITASAASGSTLVSYETYIQGVLYRGASFTSSPLTVSGTVTVRTVVTDSRGRSTQSSTNITVLAYSPPQITEFSAWRINTSGTAAQDGTRLAMKMKFQISEVGTRNDRTYNFKYKRTTDASFTSFGSGTASWTYDDTQYFTSAPEISVDYTYVVRLEIADYFQTVAYEANLSTAFTLMDFNSSGKGIAFGKVSESDTFEMAMPATVSGATEFTGAAAFTGALTVGGQTVADVATGVGTTSTGVYITFGGLKIVTGTFTIPFYTSADSEVNVAFGVTFTSAPVVIVAQVFNTANITVFTSDISTTGFKASLPAVGASGSRGTKYIAIGK